MPTAAKLLAAFAFAAVAFFAAEVYKPGLPPETRWASFTSITALIGAYCGWRVMGRLVGRGYYASAGYGVRTSATIVFYALLGFSIYEMVLRSLRRRYDGVMSAFEGIFDLALIYGAPVFRMEPLIVLIAGGVLAGMLAEWTSRQWR